MSGWSEDIKAAFYKDKPAEEVRSCFCVGPQNGDPLCPCRMRDVIVRDGRFILPGRDRDLGPAPKEPKP